MNHTILLVEDDRDDAFLLKLALRRANIPCNLQTTTTIDAIEHYLSGRGIYADRQKFPMPDLIITDLSFGAGSGLELLQWLQQSTFRSVPVLCVTGSDDPADVAKARELALGCFRKSALFEDVVEIVQQVLEPQNCGA